jgi:DNA helicase II / ATP-dependent DNA helicase PcrA
MVFNDDTQADLEIRSCIDNYQNFTVVAGAGSGKTGSLVKALMYIRHLHGKDLRSTGKKVACITYTNAAVEIIKRRTNLDELFSISTIHRFLWDSIKNYQSDIRVVINELILQRIEKKKESDNGGQSKNAIKARNQVERLTQELSNLPNVESFTYDDSGRRNYLTGHLDHDDIVDLTSLMILRLPMLRKIIGQKFPYIFIDEAQDTFSSVIDAFNLIAQDDGLPTLGYFGDPMQQIYEDNRAGEFKGPVNTVLIKKHENYRCSSEVIRLLNTIRTDLQQTAGNQNATGSVKIRLIKAEEGTGSRKTYSEDQLKKALREFDEAMIYFNWLKSDEIKCLFLTRQMIAHRLGFTKLNRLFTGEYASKNTEDTFKEGSHFILKPFIDILIPLMEAHSKNDQITMMQIMRLYSPLLNPEGINKQNTVKEIIDKAHIALNAIAAIWHSASIRDIFDIARKHEIINISERLAEQLDRAPRTETYDEILYVQEKGDWLIDEFLSQQTNELSSYRNFILELTPFSTQHGVKGDEFEKVLVVFDDTEANWNNYNFSRLLTPATAGKEPTDSQRQRSLNLAYVCFSRAIRDLRIILFTMDPSKAKQELISKGLFSENQISIQ